MSLALLLLIGCAAWKKHMAEGDAWMEKDNPGAASRAPDQAAISGPLRMWSELVITTQAMSPSALRCMVS